MPVRFLMVLALTLLVSGCLSHDPLSIPPGPETPPPGADIYVYVAESRNETLENFGGAVSVYPLGANGEFVEGPATAPSNDNLLGAHYSCMTYLTIFFVSGRTR